MGFSRFARPSQHPIATERGLDARRNRFVPQGTI